MRYLLNASLLTLFSALSMRGGIFIANIILARHFHQDAFGLISFAYLTAINLGNFASSALVQAGAKTVGRVQAYGEDVCKDAVRLVGKVSFVLIGFIALAVIGSADFLAKTIVDNQELADYLRVGGVVLFFSASSNVATSMMYSLDLYGRASVISALSSALMVAVLYFAVGVENPIFGLSVLGLGGLIHLFLSLIFIKHKFSLKPSSEKSSSSIAPGGVSVEFYSTLKPALLIAVIGAPVHWICTAILANGQNGVKELANFNVAFQFYMIVLFVPATIGNMLVSVFSKARSSSKREEKRLLMNALGIVSVTSILVGSPLIVYPESMTFFYGSNYGHVLIEVRLLAIAAILGGVSVSIQQYFASQNRMWLNFKLSVFYALLYVSSTKICIMNGMGALGQCTAIVIASSCLLVFQLLIASWQKKQNR